ncbi:MAG: hypothetical protein K6T65_03675 [Peptococcaceae bacterium]|nr:hypothetical protein [Peptococcaceae bacterium]
MFAVSKPEDRVDRILREIESFSAEEIRELLTKMAERFELLGWLRVAESSFSEWDNPEDAAYDRI